MPAAKRVRINSRDVRTLAAVGEYGVLDRPLCRELCFAGSSDEWCRQNLARLAAAGLLRAITLRVWHDEGTARGGRIPTLYGLTRDGAEVVAVRTGSYPPRVLRSDPAPATHWHRLQVVRVRVAFDRAAATAGLAPPAWIMEQDIRPDAADDAMPLRRRVLFHEFRGEGGAVTCRPDAAAVLTIPHPSGEAARASSLAVHFEVDRSTEGTAQCRRKLPGYAALFAERAFSRYWPDLPNPAHRVFWVAPSRQRVDVLRQALRDAPVSEAFRFCTSGDCRPDRVLTRPVWCDVQGATKTLYRPTGGDADPPLLATASCSTSWN